MAKNLPANAGDARDAVSIPGVRKSPEGGNGATLSSILPWKIPWTQEPVGLYSPWVTKSQTGLKDCA